jgi:hypothetical protein
MMDAGDEWTLIREVRVEGRPADDAASPWRASRVLVGVTVRDDGAFVFPATSEDSGTISGSSPATVCASFTSATVELAAGADGAADVTGGVAGKMREAASVARRGVDVYVSDCARHGAAAAIRGRVDRATLEIVPDGDETTEPPRPWFGTLVRGVENRV